MFSLDSALGVEIRGNSLILATIRKGVQDYTLRHSTVIENYRELPPLELRNSVKRFLNANGFNRENVIVGLPRDEAVIRYLELPLEVEENLDEVVRFQVEKFEPAEDKGSYYDYLVVKRAQEKRKILLQLLMVPRERIDEYLSLFRELDLYPAAVRLSGVGRYALFSVHKDGFPKTDPYLVLDIHTDAVEIGMLTASRFLSEKIPLSPAELTFERIIQEVDVFLSRIKLESEGLSKIYLTGPGRENFLEEFRSRFIDCELLTGKVSLKQKSSSRLDLDQLAGAVGLAMSGMSRLGATRFNLIPAEKRVIGERPSLIPTALLAGLLVMMGGFVGIREYVQNRSLVDQVDQELQQRQSQVEQALALREQVQQSRLQLAELQDLMKGRQKVLMVLKELTEKIPEDAFLQNVNIQGEKVSITGHAASASALLPVLLNSRYFRSVENRYITPDKSMGNKDKFNFELMIQE